ncbi:MAG: STM3941 family protein [Mangrovibacterium sp.]
MDIDNGEIRIKVSKTKVLVQTSITTGLLTVCLWTMYKVVLLSDGFNRTYLIVGISTLIISFGLGCISSLNKLVDSNQGLILNDTGIQINIGPNRGQFVPWNQIRGLKIYSQIRGGAFLLIFVKNPDQFMTKSNRLRRFLLKMNNVSHKTPVSLTSNWLDCSIEELFATINDRIKKNT